MPATAAFIAQIEELLEPLGGVRIRRVFSSNGVYRDGIMFALIADDTLYLKADAATRPLYEAEGQTQFVTNGKGKNIALPYWSVPERLLDDPDELLDWARTAFSVALRTPQATAKSKRLKPA